MKFSNVLSIVLSLTFPAVAECGLIIFPPSEFTVGEGEVFTFEFIFQETTQVADSLDFEVDVNWGDGSLVANQTDFTAGFDHRVHSTAHAYGEEGIYSTTLVVRNNQTNEIRQDDFAITVLNLDPVLESIGNFTVELGRSLRLDAAFSDAGFFDTHVGSIDWGDGDTDPLSVSETFGSVGVPTTGVVSGSHTFGALGTYNVAVSVFDDDGGSVEQTFAVEVVEELAEPVPEPSTLALLGIGGLGMCGCRWRRGRKSKSKSLNRHTSTGATQ